MEKTIHNLAKAFIGESQARNRYTFYSKVAKDEGLQQISKLFLLTADNEKEHAKWLMRLMNELKQKEPGKFDEIQVDQAPVPTAYSTTADNLKSAIAGENYEHVTMYPEFAQVAADEGLTGTAKRLQSIAKAEGHHEERYTRLLEQVEKGTVFKKDREAWWVCQECGYAHFGKEPPLKCPACDHAQGYYEIKCEEY